MLIRRRRRADHDERQPDYDVHRDVRVDDHRRPGVDDDDIVVNVDVDEYDDHPAGSAEDAAHGRAGELGR